MRTLRVAMGFLTILPVAPRDDLQEKGPPNMGPSRAYFPLVGLAIGGMLAGLDVALREAFPVGVASALVLAAALVVTRAMHAEGFIDCCDALLGGYTRERRLEIMRDPHVGAFAVLGGAALVLAQWTAIEALPGPVRWQALVLYPCLSRWAMVVAMVAFPYVRREGMGTAFTRGANRWQVAMALGTAALAAALFGGWAGVAMLAAAMLTALALGRWIASLLGGMTGDGYGAVCELASLAALLAAIGVWEGSMRLFRAPLGYGGIW